MAEKSQGSFGYFRRTVSQVDGWIHFGIPIYHKKIYYFVCVILPLKNAQNKSRYRMIFLSRQKPRNAENKRLFGAFVVYWIYGNQVIFGAGT